MATRDELDALSSKDLHDRAFARAERHLDLRFFFDLLTAVPAAAASTGDLDRSRGDIFALRRLTTEVFDSDEGDLADALRPFYIDYLMAHPTSSGGA